MLIAPPPALRRLSVPLIALLIAAAVGLTGCDEPDPMGPPDDSAETAVRNAVNEVPDRSEDAASFNSLFVGGKAPEGVSAADYYPLRTEAKAVEVAGDRATVQVAAATAAEYDAAGEDGPPTVEWTFVRDGDAWLLESAPLP
ncbi:hypothetical protein [Alienimonas sp. DA493]|uniref:hypothetical protein n=1 Tax=Alienimonas sp. DA493 TaxID=3373605 RepID=UPI003754FF03